MFPLLFTHFIFGSDLSQLTLVILYSNYKILHHSMYLDNFWISFMHKFLMTQSIQLIQITKSLSLSWRCHSTFSAQIWIFFDGMKEMKTDLCANPVLFSFYEGHVGSCWWWINKSSMPSKYYSFVVTYVLVGASLGFKPHPDGKTSGIKKISGKQCNIWKSNYGGVFLPGSDSSVKTVRKKKETGMQINVYVLDCVCVISGCMHSF